MVEKLEPGHLHGHITRSVIVSDFIFTESAFEAHTKLPRHTHVNSYFCFVLQGIYTERCSSREVVCRPSALTFRASDETHEAVVHDKNARVFVMEIPSPWIERLRADSLTLKSNPELCGTAVRRLCAHLNHEFHKTDRAAKLAIEGLALELLAEATRQPAREMTSAPPWLRQAREMIVEQYPEPLKLTQIANSVGVHPVYLATAFRQKFGVTIGEFLRRLRIEHACAELVESEFPISEIALRAGFFDQSHFSKVFKSYVGTTPAKYRKAVGHS